MGRIRMAVLVCFAAAALVLAGCSSGPTETMSKAGTSLSGADYNTANTLYDAAIEEGHQLEACYRGKGIALMGMLEYDQAAEAFENALQSKTFIEKTFYKNDSMDLDIKRYLASCYVRTGNSDKAEELYDELIDKKDDDPQLYKDRGTAKAAAGDIDGAKEDFDYAINLDRRDYELILEIAQILDQYGARDYGTAYLQNVPSLDESVIEPVLQGKILYYLGDYEEAIEKLQSSVSESDDAAVIVCKSYLALGDTASATQILTDLGDAVENSVKLLSMRGSIEMQAGDYTGASADFEKAATLAQGTEDLQTMLYNRAVSYEYQGDFETAKELFTQYLQSYPGDQQAQREMLFLQTR